MTTKFSNDVIMEHNILYKYLQTELAFKIYMYISVMHLIKERYIVFTL